MALKYLMSLVMFGTEVTAVRGSGGSAARPNRPDIGSELPPEPGKEGAG
jgi:hypothetical protein